MFGKSTKTAPKKPAAAKPKASSRYDITVDSKGNIIKIVPLKKK